MEISEKYQVAWEACRDANSLRMEARAKVYNLRARVDKAFHVWAFTSPILGTQKQLNQMRKLSDLLCQALAEVDVAEARFTAAQDLRTAVAVRGWRGERV